VGAEDALDPSCVSVCNRLLWPRRCVNTYTRCVDDLTVLPVALVGVLFAIFLGYYITLGKPDTDLLPTAQAGSVMAALVLACIVLPGMAIWAVSLQFKSRCRHSQFAYKRISQQLGAEASYGAAEGCSMPAAAVAAAAAAADVVRHGGCGRLVTCSSGEVYLQLPALHTAHIIGSSSADVNGTDIAAAAPAAAGQLWCGSSDDDKPQWLPVTTGRPPLQQLIEGWLATLQQLPQLPQSDHKDAAAEYSLGSSSSKLKQQGRRLRCNVYAMGPAALVADAQLLCGGMKGLHFVQKAYQL
jgi:hypothetical protein